jgi:hypothetical protein
MFHCAIANPVDSGILADGLVEGVYQDNFKKFENSILCNPVGIEDAQITTPAPHSFLGNTAKITSKLQLIHSLVGGLAIHSTLGHLSLPTTTANTSPIDYESLFGFIAQASGLIGAGGAGDTYNFGELPVFPTAHSEEEAHNIRLLLPP